MAIILVRKITTRVTGVAGSPFYISAYFDANVGSAADNRDAWHNFVTAGDVASAQRSGSIWTTGGECPIVDVATGATMDVDVVSNKSVAGSSNTAILPTSQQLLVRWRTSSYNEGRRLQGKTNLPLIGVGAATNDGGSVVSTVVGDLDTRAAALISNPLADLVVYSRRYKVADIVTSGSCWNNFSVLRSRRD